MCFTTEYNMFNFASPIRLLQRGSFTKANRLFILQGNVHFARAFALELIEQGEALLTSIIQCCASKNAVFFSL